ncbi:MAG: hypothetical protein QM715_02450 [Nibricoccus sp.]
MKINAAFAKSLLLVASFGLVAPLLAQAPAKRKAGPAPAQQEETAKPEEAEPVVPGTVINRADGSFLSVTIENNCFKIAFYDTKKMPKAPDVTRAAVRWSPKNKKGDERRILNASSDGQSLISPPPVLPPHNFRIFVTLLNDKDEAVETYNTDFRE